MNNFVKHNEKEIKGFFGDKRWLSNFYPSVVYYHPFGWRQGFEFFYLENAYQFCKLPVPKPNTEPSYKYGITHPKVYLMKPEEAKKWGRTIPIRKDWDKVKYEIMANLVFSKFYNSNELRKKLIATGNRYLEESNMWHDNYWGKCYCHSCTMKDDSARPIIPQNNLGKILMKIREFWK